MCCDIRAYGVTNVLLPTVPLATVRECQCTQTAHDSDNKKHTIMLWLVLWLMDLNVAETDTFHEMCRKDIRIQVATPVAP